MKISTKKFLLIAIITVVVLLLGTTVGFIISNVTGNTVLSIESAAVLPGDRVSLKIDLGKNKGFFMGSVTLEYDASAMEFVSCAGGDVFDACETNAVNGQVIMIVNQNDLSLSKENGTIATLNFNIKSNADKGVYYLKFVEETAFCNLEDPEDLIIPDFENGKIVVK